MFIALVLVAVAFNIKLLSRQRGHFYYWGFLILPWQYVMLSRVGLETMQCSFYENSFLLVSCAHSSGWLYRFHGARSAGGGLNYANSFLVFFLCAPQWCDRGRNQMGYHRSLTTGNFLIMLCCTCNCANA